MAYDIQIISAPSTLGLRSDGVEHLPKAILKYALPEKIKSAHEIITVPTLNHLKSGKRDPKTLCLNPTAIKDFSVNLMSIICNVLDVKRFAFTLGGDCSILLGIAPALKQKGKYGLVFIDAHADFYEVEKSTTGEVADMDLAIITGRGPELLANIHNLKPYIDDENVIHLGQRDWEETKKYGSQDIKDTTINCFDLDTIRKEGIDFIINNVLHHISLMDISGFWIHFDTDVLDDAINPAVDYRLSGGLTFKETEKLIGALLATQKAVGISITIYNPSLDKDGHIARNISDCLATAFKSGTIL